MLNYRRVYIMIYIYVCVYIKILSFIIILIELKTPSRSRYSLPLSTWFLQVVIASFSGLPKGFLPIQYCANIVCNSEGFALHICFHKSTCISSLHNMFPYVSIIKWSLDRKMMRAHEGFIAQHAGCRTPPLRIEQNGLCWPCVTVAVKSLEAWMKTKITWCFLCF